MKILFICSTEFQLFNALNLKLHVFPLDKADIILQFLKKDTVDFYHRIKETGLFENVCYRLPDFFGIHEYSRRIRSGDFSGSFLEASRNSIEQFYVCCSSFRHHEYINIIKKNVYNFDKLDFESYQQVFVGGTNEIVVNVIQHIRCHNPACRINLYEEGIGSYIHDNLGADSDLPVDNVYLYEPCLALYHHDSFLKIPKISRSDVKFISLINRIFDYKEGAKEIKHKIIFFDNHAAPMPEYLNRSKFLSKTLFRNPYKKHLHDHQVYILQLEVYKMLAMRTKGRCVLVKLHPRTERKHIEADYMSPETRIMENISVPWEVFCCNCKISDNIFITLESSAALSNAFVMDEEDNNKAIVLIGYKELETIPKYKAFFQKIKDQKIDYGFYLPTDERQYISALDQCLEEGRCNLKDERGVVNV